MDILKDRALDALKNIANGTAKVSNTGAGRLEVIKRLEKMAGTSYCVEVKKAI